MSIPLITPNKGEKKRLKRLYFAPSGIDIYTAAIPRAATDWNAAVAMRHPQRFTWRPPVLRPFTVALLLSGGLMAGRFGADAGIANRDAVFRQ
ncbi:hypothetical protein JZM24_11940 [Candidatus Sodalis endolongispinus]|uniref:Uncharacterized protein n=1 Tax=Candidatus Sodalis endolongispinus TaxID=2812662 RepID=A0ABS5YCB0_9GAMM|nr:hypothetical protein [Candidatus Sodalis endolongispinus]MBT9432654.1 hypothetical protein [Candidatus Sodalis endolongispinus]